ncbi:MAG: M48 family metalloprotease [Candidatus Omnitrophica bacterium]|nr:M48 family metalloprotease [Candidatus Omnitrophota bacterium]
MLCPNCNEDTLVPVMTKQGVEIDACSKCEGIWLDKDEIYHFTSAPTYLKSEIDKAIGLGKQSRRISPVFNKPLLELPLFEGKLDIDYCTVSEGIWLDKDEINMLPSINARVDIDKSMLNREGPSLPKTLFALPSLALRSGMVLFGLYALLTLFLISLVEFMNMPVETALLAGIIIAVLHFVFGPFLMDLSLRFLYRMSWVAPEELPGHLKDFISSVCRARNIKFPRVGIIIDGSPNAFTYGHHPNNARIVLTKGLLDLLDDKEVEAVVAHEIGHIVHWDMLIMTLAQLVPLVLYYIYRTLIRIRTRGRDKSAPYRMAIAISAYVLYIISEFIVLWFSRLREYFADRFSGEVTGNPQALCSALVKIGYGLAGDDTRKKDESNNQRQDALRATEPLGIFDSRSANILAITGYLGPHKMGGEIDKEKLKDSAKWDLWNPWATYYELQSTHPLIAKRLRFLSNQSLAMGQAPYVEFDERRPESYWDDFFVDMAMKLLPVLAIIGGGALYLFKRDLFALGMGLFSVGSAYLVLMLYSYPTDEFAPLNVRGLLKKIKVSAVRPVPCVIRGKIIGRGVPGLIYSEDFVMQDDTGIIFLDYNQPLGIFNFFFGLLRASSYINQEAVITGWYRRCPVPYIEIKSLRTADRASNCYAYLAKFIFAFLLIALGIGIVIRSFI